MKKTIAKVLSVLLVAIMAIAMIPAVSAAEVTIDTTKNRTITVINSAAGTTSEGTTVASADLQFTAYKVATFTQTADNKLVYTTTDKTTSTDLNAESTAADVVLTPGATGTPVPQVEGTDTFVLDAGTENALYLIKCTAKPTNVKNVSSVLVQVPNMFKIEDGEYKETTEWQYTATVTPKFTFQTTGSSKDIVTNAGLADSITASEGDVVKFQLEATVLGTKADPMALFSLKDTMTAGLTLVNKPDSEKDDEKVKVYGVKADNSETDITDNFKVEASEYNSTTGTTIDISAKSDFLTDDLYDYVTVRVVYTATVNENAVMGSTGNPNTVYLAYDNDTEGEASKTEEDSVTVYTYGIQILKKDADGTTALAGAEFEIKQGNKVFSGTTATDGTLDFKRLAPGTYTVTETKAPAGYQLLASPITVTLTADNATTDGMYQITVTNSKFLTPVTGGVGTTIFVVVGLAMIVMGGTLLFVATRKKESK